jgi:hypothetical protein
VTYHEAKQMMLPKNKRLPKPVQSVNISYMSVTSSLLTTKDVEDLPGKIPRWLTDDILPIRRKPSRNHGAVEASFGGNTQTSQNLIAGKGVPLES